jgi:protein O-GlcNAc transferase
VTDPSFRDAEEHLKAGRPAEAIAACDRTLAIDPQFHPAWYASGCACTSLGLYAAAIPRFERAAALAPDDPATWHEFGTALFQLGLIDEALANYRRALALDGSILPRTAIATLIPGSPSADHAAVLDARRSWFDAHLPTAPLKPLRKGLDAGARLRIGYLSAFFGSSNWMKPVWGLIQQHDRRAVELHLFSDTPEGKCPDYRRDERDRFHDISELSYREAAERIDAADIDILVDLNGFSRVRRLAVVAFRPAPIQVAWFNMYATSGMSCFDYLIGDDAVIAPDEERHYVERIARVPGSYLTFEVRYPTPAVAEPPGVAAGRLTFGCLASHYKFTPQVIEAWSRILARAPSSRLLIRNSTLGPEENRAHLAGRFRRHGIEPDRLTLEGPAAHFDFLGTYSRIDVALDTFPYNGGTTTTESMWQGVPVLAIHGDRWAARTSRSLLLAAGLGDFVARDVDDYVDRAVRLDEDPATPGRLAELRRGMRARLAASPVCDTASLARSMEALYRQFVKERRKSEPS